MKNLKGQISLMAAVIGALGMIGASAFASWATISSKTAVVETRVGIVEEREQNHYAELSKVIEKMDRKLDLLLEKKK